LFDGREPVPWTRVLPDLRLNLNTRGEHPAYRFDMVRGAVAGAMAAAVWVAAEPLGQRVFRTPYSDVRLLGALLTAGGPWRRVGMAAHLVNGALFGAIFGRMGGAGWRQGLVVAEVENLVLWPAMALIDRIHPDRRSGSWPPLVSNSRVFAYEATMHALFGVVLGLLHPAPATGIGSAHASDSTRSRPRR